MTVKRLVLVAVLAVIPCSAQSNGELEKLLKSKDQALLDAIAPGEKRVWESLLSADFFYADENMRIISRADFLKEFQPLPRGSSGQIAISTYEMHRIGDTAIVVHRDDETEFYFGSELHAQYLMTETWQLLGRDWKLREIHCAAIPVDAPTIVLSSAQMDELVGDYQAGTLHYQIRRDGQRLIGGQPGHRETELKAETPDVLIIAGQPRSMKVFYRDGSRKVTRFADRRENRDLVWTKLP